MAWKNHKELKRVKLLSELTNKVPAVAPRIYQLSTQEVQAPQEEETLYESKPLELFKK